MDFATKLFWASLDFLTPERTQKLRNHFGDLETARKNLRKEELLRAQISERSANSVLKRLEKIHMERIQKAFYTATSRLLFFEDTDFLEPLKNIPDPPMFLFVKGNILPEDMISLSVVGTRQISQHGKQVLTHLLPEIIRNGFTIISGMARGVDTAAHKEALKNKGRTIAIWGTGIDITYPQENGKLAQDIVQNGAIISEFPLGTQPNPYNFPRRNRLVSGVSLGTLVVEGKEKSGSLITAELALEQGKEVFAVPGSPFLPLSVAPNRLIQKGEAKLVQESADILSEFGFVQRITQPRKFSPENELERVICEILSKEAMPFDELKHRSGKTSAELTSTLIMLSMRGVVQDVGMNQWVRNF